MAKRTIAVSALADYADDPAGYCERRGQPHAPKHTRRGDRAHNRLTANRFSIYLRWAIGFAVLAYAVWLAWGIV